MAFRRSAPSRPGHPRHALRMRVAVLRPECQPFGDGLGKRFGRAAFEEAGTLAGDFAKHRNIAGQDKIYVARPRSAATRTPHLRKRRSGRCRRRIVCSKSASLTSSNQNSRLPSFGWLRNFSISSSTAQPALPTITRRKPCPLSQKLFKGGKDFLAITLAGLDGCRPSENSGHCRARRVRTESL